MRRSIIVLPLLLGLYGTVAPLLIPAASAASPSKASAKHTLQPNLQRDYELLLAAADGDTKGVERALARGARIEARDGKYGFTPLMWAAWRANLGTMHRLIEEGADVNAATAFANPENVTLRESPESAPVSNMHFFVRNSGVTPLLLAASSGSAMAVDELLKKGARVEAKAVSGESPLLAAVFAGSLPAVKALLSKGADPNEITPGPVPANAPLFIAVSHGHEDIVKALLNAGAEAKQPLRIFGSYERVARHYGHPRIAALLARAPKSRVKTTTVAHKATSAKPAPQRNRVTVFHANGAVEVVR